MYDVIALGELLIDFAQKSIDDSGYPTMQANPGGAPANFLAALTKFGKKTAFLTKVGDDTFGHALIKTLDKAGIDTRGVTIDPNFFTTLAFVSFRAGGEREFAFARKPGADTQLKYDEIDLSMIDEANALHFGTLSLTNESMRTTTQKAVAYAKAKGKKITFDPNLRRPLWNSLDEAKEQILWGLQQADVVKISDEEVEFLWDCDVEQGAKRLIDEFGVSLVLLTLGSKGAIALTKNARAAVKCPSVEPIDTTGAGDICGGSALSKLIDIGKEICELTDDDLMEIATFAVTAASLSTEKMGGIPSIPDESTVLANR